jgi:hypothetical protein
MKHRQGGGVKNSRFNPLLVLLPMRVHSLHDKYAIGIVLDGAVYRGGIESSRVRIVVSMLASEFQGQGSFREWQAKAKSSIISIKSSDQLSYKVYT